MLKKLKPQSEFSRNVLTLMTGTTIAQAIPVAVSPILTRLYSPEEFGVFALYMGLATLLSVIATGRYELAVMLPRDDEEAFHVAFLSMFLATFVSLAALPLLFFFREEFSALLGSSASSWLYFVPLAVFLTGAYRSLYYWSNRKKRYEEISTGRVAQSGATAATNLSLGLAETGSYGLILGNLFGQTLAAALLGKKVLREDGPLLLRLTKTKLFRVAKKYIDHPRFLILSHGIASIYTQIPVLFIAKVFGLGALGFYSLANRLIGIPGTLVANSIGDVFREEATRQYHESGEFHDIFIRTLKKTLAVSILPFLLLYFSIEEIFAFVFGESWRIAGEYAGILIIGAFAAFVINPLDKSALIVNEVGYILRWHTARFASYAGLTVLAYLSSMHMRTYLYGLVFTNVSFYLYDLYKSYRFSKGGQNA